MATWLTNVTVAVTLRRVRPHYAGRMGDFVLGETMSGIRRGDRLQCRRRTGTTLTAPSLSPPDHSACADDELVALVSETGRMMMTMMTTTTTNAAEIAYIS